MLLCSQVLGSQVGVCFFQVGVHAAQAIHCVAKDDPELLLLGCLACQVPGLHPGATRVALKLIFNSPNQYSWSFGIQEGWVLNHPPPHLQ